MGKQRLDKILVVEYHDHRCHTFSLWESANGWKAQVGEWVSKPPKKNAAEAIEQAKTYIDTYLVLPGELSFASENEITKKNSSV